MVNKDKKECSNEQAKRDGYYIGKEKPTKTEFRFVAKLEWENPTTISGLNADRGQCNDVVTEKDYRKCGIARSLLVLCLRDEDITRDGGVNPLTYNDLTETDYAIWEDEEFGERARLLCSSIVAVTCEPIDNTPKYACKTYIEAARIAGY